VAFFFIHLAPFIVYTIYQHPDKLPRNFRRVYYICHAVFNLKRLYMQENFIVSARKYRPSTFEMVVGQDHITTTLKNAIVSQKTAHSYLFTGPRGIGKTTCARILAKALNCENRKEDGEPCNECRSCVTFNEQRSMNIYELDAASNNSVDDIRLLNEQVRFAPQTGEKRVYIIDEVHMLSTAAFNAFLKTLEEPPSYAVFILATTEKHKIIPTILSRCQVFDFKRIQIKDIKEYLVYIAGKENVEYEDSALHIIAQKADGALRDALSIFDRIISFSGNKLTYDAVIENLNLIDFEHYFRFINYFLEQNHEDTLILFNELLSAGFDGQNLMNGLSLHLRDLLLCKSVKTKTLLEIADDILPKYTEQANATDHSFILSALNILTKFNLSYKESKNQQLHTELCLLKLCHLPDAIHLGTQLKDQKKNFIIKEPKSGQATKPAPASSLQPTEKSEPDSELNEKRKEDASSEVKIEEKSPGPQQEPSVIPRSKPLKTALSIDPNKLRKQIEEDEAKKGDKPSKDKAVQQGTQPEPQLPVDKEAFFSAWEEILNDLKGSKNLYNSLKNYPPVFKDDNTVEIEFKNSAVENMFIREKQNITTRLFSDFNLKGLVINTFVKVTTREENNKYLIDSRQKFDYMKEKNPDIEYLREKLGLRFTD